MNLRLRTSIAAVTLSVLAAATSCAGTSTTATQSSASPSPSSLQYNNVAEFLKTLHDMAGDHPAEHPRLMPGKTPDSVLVAAGRKTCAGQGQGGLREPLMQEGWSFADANVIMMTAEFDGLCGDPFASPSP